MPKLREECEEYGYANDQIILEVKLTLFTSINNCCRIHKKGGKSKKNPIVLSS